MCVHKRRRILERTSYMLQVSCNVNQSKILIKITRHNAIEHRNQCTRKRNSNQHE